MELIKPGINVNFVGKMRMFFWFSITLTIVSLIYIIARGGPIMGIDFAGGTIVQVKYSQATICRQDQGGPEAAQPGRQCHPGGGFEK